jgi:hypothetical protein
MNITRFSALALVFAGAVGAAVAASASDDLVPTAQSNAGLVPAAESDAELVPVDESDVRLSAAITAGTRAFFEEPLLPEQHGIFFPYAEGWFRVAHAWNDGRSRVSFMPYGRGYARGHGNLLDLKEGYFLHVDDGWDVLVGVNTVFWGVAESRHLVNVINQIDLGGDIDGEDLLGQPMLNVNLTSPDWGTLSLFGLFGFRERDHPSRKDRLRLLPPIIDRHAVFEDSKAERHVAFAARYSNTFDLAFGSLDSAVSFFYGTNREPRFVPDPMLTFLIPHYDRMTQGGLEAVYTTGSLQAKFEGIVRHTNDETFAAVVAGGEYTIFDVFGSGADLGLMAEYLHDGRSSKQAPILFRKAVFGGLRLSLPDAESTRIRAGILFDTTDSAKHASVEFSRRLADDVLVEAELRLFLDFPRMSPFAAFDRDSFINVTFTKFF